MSMAVVVIYAVLTLFVIQIIISCRALVKKDIPEDQVMELLAVIKYRTNAIMMRPVLQMLFAFEDLRILIYAVIHVNTSCVGRMPSAPHLIIGLSARVARALLEIHSICV